MAAAPLSDSPSRFASMPWLIIAAGCLVGMISFGPRSTMGFFLTPMTRDLGWSRETFSFAIALQNLVWGIGSPFAGMIADRYGTARVVIGGAALYGIGLVLMAFATTPVALHLTAGLLMGLGIAGTAFGLVLSAFARLLPEGMRPLAFGIGTAAGSMGQFIFAPLGQGFIQTFGWHQALILMAGFALLLPLAAYVLKGKPSALAIAGRVDQTIMEAIREAFGHRSYVLLVSGFFVCGFQLGFVTTHLPPYLADIGIPAYWGGIAIGLIGLFNIFGSLSSGILSGKYPKQRLLSLIYLARAVIIAVFVILPPSIPGLLAFTSLLGFFWLSTVPPTQGLVGVMFGVRYMSTLYGFVFLSHQIGSFIAVWLGGVLYDYNGSYAVVWWLSVALGVFAAIVHLPIKEQPARLAPAAPAA
jgi:MFS family permease